MEKEETVELQEFIGIIRKMWWIIVVAALIGLAGAALATALSPKLYQTETRLFFSTPVAKDNKALKQGNDFTQGRIRSYAEVITDPKVLDPVIKTLGLNTTVESLGTQISATVSPGTVLIDIAVTDNSARRAAQIADAIGKQVTNTVPDLEKLTAGTSSPVRVTVVSAAKVPTKPISPKPATNLGLGLVLGLMLGFSLTLGRALLRTRTTNENDPFEATGSTHGGGIALDANAPIASDADAPRVP